MKRTEFQNSKRKKKLIHRVITFFILLSLFLVGTGVYYYYKIFEATNNSYNDLGREKSELREKTVSIAEDPISVLLLGIEDYSTGGSTGRSDTIMVLTFNQNKETLKMVSIPRDTLVPIVGRGTEDKINHAYAFGGTEMTIETVENFLNIPIDYYVTVNFEGFKNVVDIVGGITVDVPFDFTEDSDDHTGKLYFTKGEMKLDGKLALGYARMRKQDPRGDLGRNDRQKEVVKAVIDKLTSTRTVLKIDDLADEYGKNVVSNMKLDQLIQFYREYGDFNVSNIDQLQLEGSSDLIGGISYFIATDESVQHVSNTLRDHLNIN